MNATTFLLGSLLLTMGSPALGTDLARLQLRFEPSADGKAFVAGQVACDVRITSAEVRLPGGPTIALAGADEGARGVPEDVLPGCSTYFVGSDPAQWRQAVPQFGRVRFASIYPGIDVVHHGEAGRLEHDFLVAPGADAGRIRIAVRGPERARIDDDGDLVAGAVRLLAPIAWQRDAHGIRREIACRFVHRGARRFGFEVGEHDASRELVIDPVITWSTYLTGSSWSEVDGVSADADGSLWVAGYTREPHGDFPHLGTMPSSVGLFLVELAPEGDHLLASTFFGPNVNPRCMARDGEGGIYIAGVTVAGALPVVNALQDSAAGASGFVMKLDATGTNLDYSTYFGQTELSETVFVNGLAVDRSGRAVIAGHASGTIPTAHAVQPDPGNPPDPEDTLHDGFVAKLAPDGRSLVYSTHLGGSGDEFVSDVAVDWAGNAYVTGFTFSSDYPLANPCMPFNAGGRDAFVTKLDPSGSSLVYSTTFGGPGGERDLVLAVSPLGEATVFGAMEDAAGLPLVAPFDDRFVAGTTPLFAFRLSPFGALEKSTYLTGGGTSVPAAATMDAWGRATVVGMTLQDDFPILDAPAPSHAVSPGDAFVLRMTPGLDAIDFSCRFGGNTGMTPRDVGLAVAAGANGSLFVGGQTSAHDFPTTPGALQSSMPPPDSLFVRFMGCVTCFGNQAPNVREPSAVDLRAVPPVVVGHDFSGTRLVLGWEETLGRKEGLYEGTLASLWQARAYDHVAAVCDLGASGASILMPPGNVYFLVVDRIDDVESSYGRDSFGRERPPAAAPCR